MMANQPPTWPQAEVELDANGVGTVTIGGVTTPIHAKDIDAARAKVTSLIAETAKRLGRSIPTSTTDPSGSWRMLIHPDETITDVEARPHASVVPETIRLNQEGGKEEREVSSSFGEPLEKKIVDFETIAGHGQQPATAPTTPPESSPQPEPPMPRRSFLVHEVVEEPATQGWRGVFNRFGVRMAPGDAERSERADVQSVSQHWPGPRTIAIVNGKGGAGKTPTTILLSAVFARYGGAGVLAWDNNQTRGTLGWRTEQGPHTATLLDLLPQADKLLGTEAQAADLAHYVHHQTLDRYDVLRSQPLELASVQRVTAQNVDATYQVVSKYYRLIFIDSGNDESDPVWKRMIDHTTQLVVATTTRDDHAEAGALLLEALTKRDEYSANLAKNAVVVVSQADPRAGAGETARIADGFHGLAREAASIPFDPAMIGGILTYGALQPRTQRAWLAAASAVARGL